LPALGPSLPVQVPEMVGVFEPACDYPERWSVVGWIDGEHPAVVTPETPADPRRLDLAADLAEGVPALNLAQGPAAPVHGPGRHGYRAKPLTAMRTVTGANIER